MSDYVPSELRRQVRDHFGHCCAYCQTAESLTVVTFEVEHILPRSLGGLTVCDNLCLACPSCNRHKSNRLIGITSGGVESRLFDPRHDRWLDHFDWSVDSTLIVGLTTIGRVTIDMLRMNRPQLVAVRALWVIIGKHPPN